MSDKRTFGQKAKDTEERKEKGCEPRADELYDGLEGRLCEEGGVQEGQVPDNANLRPEGNMHGEFPEPGTMDEGVNNEIRDPGMQRDAPTQQTGGRRDGEQNDPGQQRDRPLM